MLLARPLAGSFMAIFHHIISTLSLCLFKKISPGNQDDFVFESANFMDQFSSLIQSTPVAVAVHPTKGNTLESGWQARSPKLTSFRRADKYGNVSLPHSHDSVVL